MKAIKLYGKNLASWKANNEEEARQQIDDFRKRHIVHNIQQAKATITKKNRSRMPYDVSVEFYELDTIQDILDDHNK